MNARVLIVEDDETLRLALRDNLADEGYAVETAATLSEARTKLTAPFALLILDRMLPDGDGCDLTRERRAARDTAMILMLTARNLEADVLAGFEAGADDYVEKPYRLAELLARVAALLRRASMQTENAIAFDRYRLDAVARTVTGDSGLIELTRTEFDLLACFARNRDVALTRAALLEQVWGKDLAVDAGTVDNFVSSLKKKLGWTNASRFRFRAIRGVGYRFEAS